MAGKDNEVSIVMTADISELKKEIQDAQRHIRLANAEFKAASSGMDEWDKSAEGIQKKLEQLDKVLKEQKNILQAYERQLEEVAKEQGENSKGAEDLKIKIENQKAAINKTSKEIEDWNEALVHVDDEVEEVGDDLENTTNGGLNAFTVALGNLAANIISDVINKLKDMAKETIEVGKNFDSSMANVAALSGASEEELAKLRDTAKEFGSTTKFSASEAADALGYMALAGWDADTSMNALGGVLDLAAASGMDLAEASDMVTDYMSAFNLEAEQSAYFADMMAYAQANANTNVEQLGAAFKNSAANMSAAGQDVETVTSLLAMMANQGLKGERAGTALSAVMRDITKSMKDGAIAIGETNVEVMDADGNYRDLTDILKDVEAATIGMGDAEKASALSATFTSDSIKGLNLILNAGVDNAEGFEDALRNCEGTAKSMADIMNDNLGGDLTALNSKLEGVQIAIYEKFEPALRKGIEALDGLLNVLQWVIDNGAEVAAVITGVATAVGTFMLIIKQQAILTALTAGITAVKTAFAGFSAVLAANPIGIVIALIAGLVAAFTILWNKSEDFRNFWIGLWEGIKNAVSGVWDAIIGFFKGAWDTLVKTWEGLTDFFVKAWEKIQDTYSRIASWINTNVFQPIKKFFEPVVKFFRESFNIIKELADGCWKAIKAIWSVVSSWFSSNVIEPIKKVFTGLWDGIKTAASTAWDDIKTVWSAVSTWFNTNVVEPVQKVFKGVWDGITNGAKKAWDGIKEAFGKVSEWFKTTFATAWQAVKDVFSTGGKVFEGIKDGIVSAFKEVVNAIIRGINKVIKVPFDAINGILDKIKKVEIAGVKPFDNLITRLTVPQIPELAQGGVLKRGQVGLLEGNGAEAVVPLENNKKWIAATAAALKTALKAEGLVGIHNGTTNNYSFVQNNTSPKALSRLEIYRQTNNQLQFARGI